LPKKDLPNYISKPSIVVSQNSMFPDAKINPTRSMMSIENERKKERSKELIVSSKEKSEYIIEKEELVAGKFPILPAMPFVDEARQVLRNHSAVSEYLSSADFLKILEKQQKTNPLSIDLRNWSRYAILISLEI